MADAITPKELKALMDSDRKPIIFDVRRKADFDAAPKRIGEAVWFDPEKADEWIDEIPENEQVVVYCVKGGAVSQSIADRLQQKNLNTKFLQGGIKAWAEFGGPAED
ncbi:rhodanese-like domain-containing protein [Desulfomonile tiedjei]|uniref:Rhodanese-related sulfurtransferase n=1 Tax=Desulfomonile tiedjei (strain ATCC 49306 / DSM 6799 / DCB-1) TaxID=706587 RepID=I4C048_DESTA|nr:rhodanese-like domain-containing protein [Desulfomonile tiedjei]AFM22939.1 Rhodanese-related sulfurtransferase [Desulfomonile tiedjei DSM 6799]